MEEALGQAQSWIEGAEAVLITAGAGMGVDSGLPDFRGNEGFWKAYPPYRKLGHDFMEMASPARFVDAPDLGWGFYGHRLNLYRATTPHSGFGKLLAYAETRPSGYGICTSNVDGHFQAAGFADDRITECHGSIHHLQCFQSCSKSIWAATGTSVEVDPETMRARLPLPMCPGCGGLARPNILMFGDGGWSSQRTSVQTQRLQEWLTSISGKRLVVLEFGAGTAIPTIRRFSEEMSARPEASLIRVNPRESAVPPEALAFPLGALEAIEQLLPIK